MDDVQLTRSAWWVNHKQTFAQEVGGNYIWSPTTRSDGGRNEFYDNMKRVRRGDIVFSFANARVQAVGVCTAPAALVPKPSEFGSSGDAWSDEGWQVSVRFMRLQQPFRTKDYMNVLAPTLPQKFSPIRETGDGNQGAYLATVPPEMLNALIGIIGAEWPTLNLDLTDGITPEASEDEIATAIINRTDIGETEKQQLVLARRGQGIYRRNLEQFENRCRVTGVSNPRHLRASHIKPWRMCSSFEKLDGNNGLLLSPHIDHLFDQGFISFTDGGALIVSPATDADILSRWRIVAGQDCGRLRPEQLTYMGFHRDVIFKQ